MSRIAQAVPEVASALQHVFLDAAQAAAGQSGWLQRERKLSGATFVQALVFGWLANPHASRSELAQAAAGAGVAITPQGMEQRLNETAARLLQQVLEAAVAQMLAAPAVAVPLLRRFAGVYVSDSTIINLPALLASQWPGSTATSAAGAAGSAALKAQVRLDLCQGSLHGPLLEAGRVHDARAAKGHPALTQGALHIADLGYFNLAVFAALHQGQAYYLSRAKANTLFWDQSGQAALLSQWLEQAVAQGRERAGVLELELHMGAQVGLPCRVLAVRVPPAVAAQRKAQLQRTAQRKQQAVSPERLALVQWTVLVTNVPATLLSVAEALVLYRARWQIERLFRLWKEVGQADAWRSAKPWAVLCEVYAKLLGCLVQHWLLLVGAWADPARSWHKAAQVMHKQAWHPGRTHLNAGRLKPQATTTHSPPTRTVAPCGIACAGRLRVVVARDFSRWAPSVG